jgi:hypothetical protein
VRTFISFSLFALLWLITGCKQFDNPIVAKAFHHNLYLSEVIDNTPYFESKEDSLIFLEQWINDWILRQTIMANAKQQLSKKELDFSSKIKQYEEQLLLNAYMQKICTDSSRFITPISEIEFCNDTKFNELPEYRDMVKLNYLKLSCPSKLYKKVKDIFFEEKDRVKATTQLEFLCADSIEYHLDNEHWFYTDILEKDLPFSFSNNTTKDNFDFVQDGNHYLILILDRKQQPQQQPKNLLENIKMQQLLLQQKNKIIYINQYQDSLVQKAFLEKKAIKYPILP